MSSPTIRIVTPDEDSPLLHSVITLADANTSTLGFVPQEAIKRAARKKHVIVALGENGEVLGYSWYSIARGSFQARIHHLCVDKQYRGRGAARRLVEAIKERTKHVYGIALRCRRDYDSNTFWEHLSFVPFAERPGRGRVDTRLTCYWFDHGHPHLESDRVAQLVADRLIAVIDSNVFFDICDTTRARHSEALALRADWLADFVALAITDELYLEIDRGQSEEARAHDRQVAQEFLKLRPVSPFARGQIRDHLGKVLLAPRNRADESDRSHLAAAISGGASFFVTNDRELTEQSARLCQEFDLEIVTPVEFILGIDELRRKGGYEPVRLSGSNLQVERVSAENINELYEVFRGHAASERRVDFEKRVHRSLLTPSNGDSLVVLAEGKLVGLSILARESERRFDLTVCRVSEGRLAATLARNLVAKAIQHAVGRETNILMLTDPHASLPVREACLELGFAYTGEAMVKLSMRGLAASKEIRQQLARLSDEDQCKAVVRDGLSLLEESAERSVARESHAQFERMLWPLRVEDSSLESFLIPIQPRWAKHLFEERLASQELFGVDAFLALQHENAYYRSAIPRIVTTPSRALWYVSDEPGCIGTRRICALSAIDEVIVGPAAQVFKQLRRLGVYHWADVLATAHGNPDLPIMGFRFSGTELLPHPVRLGTIRDVLKAERGVTPQFTTALRLSPTEFAKLYSIGINGQPRSDHAASTSLIGQT